MKTEIKLSWELQGEGWTVNLEVDDVMTIAELKKKCPEIMGRYGSKLSKIRLTIIVNENR